MSIAPIRGIFLPMKRYLYLDFDGVLHPNHCQPEQWFVHMPALAECLSAAAFNGKLIISSSWRFHHDLSALIARFPKPLQPLVAGATGEPHIGKHSRYEEIRAHVKQSKEPVLWRALDDSAWEFPTACQELLLCNGAHGIDDSVLAKLASWLSQ